MSLFRKIGAVLAGASLVTLTACGGADELQAGEDGNINLSFRSDVYFTGKLLPVIAGVEAGIFEEHGINLALAEGTGSATTIQTVGNQSDNIGFADAGALVQSRAKGVDTQMFYGVLQDSPLAIVARADGDIKSPEDLVGKSGGYTAGSAAEVLFPAFLSANGMSEDGIDLKNVDVPTRGQLFLSGETDFSFGLTNVTVPQFEHVCDCDLEVFTYSDSGIDSLGSGFIVNDDFAEANPEALTAFTEAYVAAVEYTNEDIERAADLFLERVPDSNISREILVEQWKASDALSVRTGESASSPGCMSDNAWDRTIDLMVEYGGVDDGRVTPENAMTNEYNPGECVA